MLSLLRRVLSQPRLLLPSLQAPDLSHLDLPQLKQRGIRYIALDKDNTLTPPHGTTLHPAVADALAQCIQCFGAESVVVVSNSAGSSADPGFGQAQALEAALGLTILRHGAQKPDLRVGQALLAHFGLLHGQQLAVVGDRLLTDVVMANALGCYTVLTQPLITKGEGVGIFLVRQEVNLRPVTTFYPHKMRGLEAVILPLVKAVYSGAKG